MSWKKVCLLKNKKEYWKEFNSLPEKEREDYDKRKTFIDERYLRI